MSRPYRVLWTESAERDLASVVYFVAVDNPANALKILKTIRRRASSLKGSPQRGRTVEELRHLRGLPFRELIFRPWRLIYQIRNREVQVLAFLDSRRDLEDLLHERLIRF